MASEDGKNGLFVASSEDCDILIIDRMLPQLNGLAIVKSVRARGKTTPVLILNALSEVDERVEGLQAGSRLSQSVH